MAEPGFNIYRGRDSAEGIDYGQPIGHVGPGATSFVLPALGWAGGCWVLAVRPVDAGGVEYADPEAIVRVRFDESGRLAGNMPPAVRDLAAEASAGRRLIVRWRFLAGADLPAAAVFQVFLGPAEGMTLQELLSGEPAGVVPGGPDSGNRAFAWTSEPVQAGIGWRVAVRAVAASGEVGPAVATIGWPVGGRAAAVPLLQVEVR